MNVTVAVATFGDQKWVNLARSRAIPSAQRQDVPVIHCHGENLSNARNLCLDRAQTEYIIYLDADDELESGYVKAMATGVADVRAPSVRYVRTVPRGRPFMPKVAGHHHICDSNCLTAGNWLVIGAQARTEALRKVGGWHEFPVYEDWDMWLRCYLAGYTIQAIPQAVYRAHVNLRSRNRGPSQAVKLAAHRAIAAANEIESV